MNLSCSEFICHLQGEGKMNRPQRFWQWQNVQIDGTTIHYIPGRWLSIPIDSNGGMLFSKKVFLYEPIL